MSTLRRRLMMAGKKSPIPPEYQLVEYIENTSNSYINLNIPVNTLSRWEVDFQFFQTSVEVQQGGGSGNNGRFLFGVYQNMYHFAIGPQINNVAACDYIRHYFIVDAKNKIFKIDEFSFTAQAGYLGTDNIYLFRRNGTNTYAYGRVFQNKFIQNDVILRDMYPVYRKLDHKPGMYDIINNTFYTNQGSGEFIVGPDKTWQG